MAAKKTKLKRKPGPPRKGEQTVRIRPSDGKPDRRGAAKGRRGQEAHKPNDDIRERVMSYAAMGTPMKMMGFALGISVSTLRKYYKDELEHGLEMANASVGGVAYRNAIDRSRPDNQRAVEFWMRTRARWSTREVDPGEGFAPPQDGEAGQETPTMIRVNLIPSKKQGNRNDS